MARKGKKSAGDGAAVNNMEPSGPAGALDEDPTIEPRGDIEAQLHAMAQGGTDEGRREGHAARGDGEGTRQAGGAVPQTNARPRLGVWFSRLNFIEHYRLALRYPREQVLVNFDGLGGVMVANSEATAQDLLAQKARGIPVRTIIGRAIGAGDGKPLNNTPARIVQLRTPNGAVVRESAVPAEEAAALAESWGERAVILTVDETLTRRALLHYRHTLQ